MGVEPTGARCSRPPTDFEDRGTHPGTSTPIIDAEYFNSVLMSRRMTSWGLSRISGRLTPHRPEEPVLGKPKAQHRLFRQVRSKPAENLGQPRLVWRCLHAARLLCYSVCMSLLKPCDRQMFAAVQDGGKGCLSGTMIRARFCCQRLMVLASDSCWIARRRASLALPGRSASWALPASGEPWRNS